MPHFYARQLPLGFGGLILANFVCDAMQTLVSGVNSITAVASQDVLEREQKLKVSNRRRLWTARLLTLVLGLGATLIALGVARLATSSGKNIIDLMPRTFNMFLGPLGALFLIGMFVPRASPLAAKTAVLAALVISVCWSYCREIFNTPFDLSISWAIALPCLSGIMIACAVSQLVPASATRGREYTWWAVMRRPIPKDGKHALERPT
jgi:SSS family solute:Na+ symporter